MSEDFTELRDENGADGGENPAAANDNEVLAVDGFGEQSDTPAMDAMATDMSAPAESKPAKRANAAVIFAAAGALRRFFRKDSMPNLVLVLGLVSLSAALLLSVIFRLTEPRILASKDKAVDGALGTVFAAELSFRPSPYDDRVFEGRDGGGELQGFSVRVAPMGYGGEIEMIVGVSLGLEITGVAIVSHRESVGYGTKLTEQVWFLEQFVGQTEDIRPGGAVDGISGATRSSGAVIEGVAQARQIVLDLVTEDGEDKGAAG